MSDGDELIRQGDGWATVVPGLAVTELQRSVNFYTRYLGFECTRSEPATFAVLALGREQVVLNQSQPGDPLLGEPTAPIGRGLVLTVRVGDPRTAYEALRRDKYQLVVPMEISEIEANGERFSQASFVVADPDGYLLRISD